MIPRVASPLFATSSTPRGEALLPAASTIPPMIKGNISNIGRNITASLWRSSVLPQIVVLVIVGIWRTLDLRLRVIFQFLHHNLDGFFQLRIFPLPPGRRIEINFDIGCNAMVLHFPLAFQTIDRRARSSHSTAVDQFGVASDTYQSAPSSLSDQRTNSRFSEVPRQRISSRT